jgi:hypothetical protein
MDDFETHPIGTANYIKELEATVKQAADGIASMRKILSLVGSVADEGMSVTEFKKKLEQLDEQ